jgi:hypothetical protein
MVMRLGFGALVGVLVVEVVPVGAQVVTDGASGNERSQVTPTSSSTERINGEE